MKAMVLRELGPLARNPHPLSLSDMPEPSLAAGEVLIRIRACGVCHTELDEIEGRTPPPHLPVVLGHQVVGIVEAGAGLQAAAAQAVADEQATDVAGVGGQKAMQASESAFTATAAGAKDSMQISRVISKNPFQPPNTATTNPFQNMEVAPAPESVPVVEPLRIGQRVGVAWIYSACGKCKYCLSGNENLCQQFQATGRDADGGYAQLMKAHAGFVHPIPETLSDAQAAPLLCAGAVGYRALRLSNLNDGENLGLSGFGASNHLVLKMVAHKYPDAKVFVFSRNPEEREFARSLGAAWAGSFDEAPPEQLHAAIDATPVWRPILVALKHLAAGGRLVINAIRKEEVDKDVLLQLDYPSQLWLEKEIKSVANVTRRDVREFLELAAEANLQAEVQEYDLKDANQALGELKQGQIRGAKVLRVS